MTTTISKQKPMILSSFLKSHTIKKDSSDSSKKSTNTRIGDESSGIFGGNYSISHDEYPEFLNMVYREVFIKKKPEYLTEAQLDAGPLLVDVDMRHDLSIQTRQYTEENIQELIEAYLVIFKEIFQFENEATVQFYFFEKQTVNPVPKKGYTKDGMHFIISLHCDRVTQQLIRKKVISSMDDTWNKEEMKLSNDWESMFDIGISTGKTNWQLIGCRKPNHEPYELSQIYTATFDDSDGEFGLVLEDLSSFNMKEDIYKLSARYTDHYQPFMSSKFTEEYNSFLSSQTNKRGTTTHQQTNKNISNEYNELALSITNREQLKQCLESYVDDVSKNTEDADKYKCYEAYLYVFTLPPQYYESGTYLTWFDVCCALHNTSYDSYIVFMAFSAQSTNYNFDDRFKDFEMWKSLTYSHSNKLTLGSIIYWSRTDALEKYIKIKEKIIAEKNDKLKENELDYLIEQSIDSGLGNCNIHDKKSVKISDNHIARVVHHVKKDIIVCVSAKSDIWYVFNNHRWKDYNSGCELGGMLSDEFAILYQKKGEQFFVSISECKEDEEAKKKNLEWRNKRALEIYQYLNDTRKKSCCMTECRIMFSPEKNDKLKDFMKKLDTNEYLLGCSNGVFDFKEGIFRAGKPEDFITKSTKIDYVELGPEHDTIVEEINDFMSKLFPIEELRKYVWNHLASTLIGKEIAQTFNCYLGAGRNGKSVLMSLMKIVLGEYFVQLTPAAVTQKRPNMGGTCTEIVDLKGARYVVMPEPSKGDIINDGILKQYTGGDEISARGLYDNKSTKFTAQFRFALMTNNLPEINTTDFGMWRRIRVVPFMSLFTENPVQNDPHKPYQYAVDTKIIEKFDIWKTVFLSMLVNVAKEMKGNVPDCDTVLNASNEYRNKQDVISQFINDKIEQSKGAPILKKSSVNQEFTIWHQSNFGTKGPRPKEVHDCLDRIFGPHEKTGWKDLKLVYDNERDDVINEDDIDDPF